jgi:hypothetical protein
MGASSAESRQNSTRQQLMRLGYVLAFVFVGTVTTEVLAALGFSASGCLLSRVIRCFSIPRDTIGVALIGLEMGTWPALVAASLIAAIVRVRGSVAWWNVLIVAPVSLLILDILTAEWLNFIGGPEFLIASAILFVGVQLSLFVCRLVGRVPI